jgi:hypothetical protein
MHPPSVPTPHHVFNTQGIRGEGGRKAVGMHATNGGPASIFRQHCEETLADLTHNCNLNTWKPEAGRAVLPPSGFDPRRSLALFCGWFEQ